MVPTLPPRRGAALDRLEGVEQLATSEPEKVEIPPFGTMEPTGLDARELAHFRTGTIIMATLASSFVECAWDPTDLSTLTAAITAAMLPSATVGISQVAAVGGAAVITSIAPLPLAPFLVK